MSRLVVGVIGHVDHGKSALVRALTGIETDRLAEERARGISIALGFAHCEVAPGIDIDLIDMPGHERFVRTMVSGATGIDAVVLVVAANEGVQPQTIEHVEIAGLLGLDQAIVVVSKVDLVEPEEAGRTGRAAAALLARCGLHCAPPIMASAPQGQGIDRLRQALADLAAMPGDRAGHAPPFLPIDRAFAMTGHGVVVTGTLRGSAIAQGAMLELLPARQRVRVRGVQVHGQPVTSAMPGQRVAVNLRGVDRTEVERGMALSEPGVLAGSNWLAIALRTTAGAPPLRNGMRLRALYGTAEGDVRLRLLDRDELLPGEAALAQLHSDTAMVVPVREHVILRLPAPVWTVAGGRVLETSPRRLRRKSAGVLDRLAALRDLSPDDVVADAVARAGLAGTDVATLTTLSGLTRARIAELLAAMPVADLRDGPVVERDKFDRLIARLPRLLGLHPAGLTRDRLAEALPAVGTAVLDAALGHLLAARVVAKRGAAYVTPRPDHDQALAQDDSREIAGIELRLREAGLTPPLPAEILTGPAQRRAVERLLRDGKIVRAVDRAKTKELLFHREAITAARTTLAPLLAGGEGLLVTEIVAALGITRKFAMPLLDHLDTIRFTIRTGDRRKLHRHGTGKTGAD